MYTNKNNGSSFHVLIIEMNQNRQFSVPEYLMCRARSISYQNVLGLKVDHAVFLTISYRYIYLHFVSIDVITC